MDRIHVLPDSEVNFEKMPRDRTLFRPYEGKRLLKPRPLAGPLFALKPGIDDKRLPDILRGKRILLMGGGESAEDVTSSPEFAPAAMLNIDPYLPSEKVSRGEAKYYRSLPVDPTTETFIEELRRQGYGQFDEMWMTFSVPHYCKNGGEIEVLFANLYELLAPGGYARDYPVGFYLENLPPEQKAERLHSLESGFRSALNDLAEKDDIELSAWNNARDPEDELLTLIIHKQEGALKKAAPETTEGGEQGEYLIVEVGAGDSPFLLETSDAYREQFRKDPGVRYVGLDIDKDALAYGKKAVEEKDRELNLLATGRVEFRHADGEKLPFADNSISELILKDIIGDRDIFPRRKANMLNEAARALKPGGILKIIEQQTPALARSHDIGDYIAGELHGALELVGELEKVGLFDESAMDRAMTTPTAGKNTSWTSFVVRYRKKAASLDKARAGV